MVRRVKEPINNDLMNRNLKALTVLCFVALVAKWGQIGAGAICGLVAELGIGVRESV